MVSTVLKKYVNTGLINYGRSSDLRRRSRSGLINYYGRSKVKVNYSTLVLRLGVKSSREL